MSLNIPARTLPVLATVALGAALLSPTLASATALTATSSSLCTVARPGATSLAFAATMRLTATLPDRILPGGRFGVTDIQQTVSLDGTAVKTLSSLGFGGQLRGARAFADPGLGTRVSTAYATSTRAPFDLATWDLDPAKTTYKPTSFQLGYVPLIEAFTAPTTTGVTGVRVDRSFTGALVVDQWFGQATFPVTCTGVWGPATTFPVATYAPTITSVTPNTGPAAGGTRVTISGSDLDTSRILIGGKTAPIVSQRPREVVVTTPAGGGTQRIQAVANGLRSASTLTFAYQGTPPPNITNTAISVIRDSSSTVNFNLKGPGVTYATRVTLNGVDVVSFTPTLFGELAVRVKSLPRGSYPLVLTSPGGTSTATVTFVLF
ncbi:MAG: IPT/TIG domain-containing protein [Solirubrobacteraceae bacterium]|nr:IPT/TIG domain-containing protein [Solirubrobacteraceae bacterium]